MMNRKLHLGDFVNSMLGKESKYASVDVEYLSNGHFTLSAEKSGKRIIYDSQVPYVEVNTSPLLSLFSKKLGGPMEFRRMAPSMVISEIDDNKSTKIVYDRTYDVLFVKIQKEGQLPVRLSGCGPQLFCTDLCLTDAATKKLALSYVKIFKEQQKLLRVKYYQKQALDKII